MDTSQYLDAVLDNVTLLIGAANKAGLDAPVPTCPKWKVSDLVIHQGRVLRWMGDIVGEKSQENIHPGTLDQPDGEDPLYWLKSGAQRALQILDDTDPDTAVWNWFDDKPAPARFWFRRMAHEVAVHRADAEAAAGRSEPTPVEPAELASDGIDEYVEFLPLRTKDERRAAMAGSYHFHTTDVPGEWVVVFDAERVAVSREHAKADVAIRGAASDVELFLYNRRGNDRLEIFGDPAKVAGWAEHIRF